MAPAVLGTDLPPGASLAHVTSQGPAPRELQHARARCGTARAHFHGKLPWETSPALLPPSEGQPLPRNLTNWGRSSPGENYEGKPWP